MLFSYITCQWHCQKAITYQFTFLNISNPSVLRWWVQFLFLHGIFSVICAHIHMMAYAPVVTFFHFGYIGLHFTIERSLFHHTCNLLFSDFLCCQILKNKGNGEGNWYSMANLMISFRDIDSYPKIVWWYGSRILLRDSHFILEFSFCPLDKWD